MKTNPKIKHYTYRITWSEEDAEYVGLCAEFPSLSYLASTIQKALQGILKVVAEVIADMEANNESIPEPLSDKQYSGKVLVRMPPQVHRTLTIEAAEEHVSLNRLINARLSFA